MMTALANQASVDKVVNAFFERRHAAVSAIPRGGGPRGYRYWTDGREIRIWGNPVAWWDGSNIVLTNAGWCSVITKQMLNEVLNKAYRSGVTNSLYIIQSVRGFWKILEFHEDRFLEIGRWHNRMVLTQDNITPAPGAVATCPSGRIVIARRLRRRYKPSPPKPPPKPPTLFNSGRLARPFPRVLRNLHTQEEHDRAKVALMWAYRYAVDALLANQQGRYYYYLGVLAGIAGIAERERSRWAKSVYKKAVSYIRKLKQLDHRALVS